MKWMDRYKNFGRLATLALFVAAVIGPWAYSLDGVPPPEWCAAPNYLLESGRCARQVSGLEILTFMAFAFPAGITFLVNGNAFQADGMREFGRDLLLTGVLILLVLPFITTLLKIWSRDFRRVRIIHLRSWVAAAGLSLLLPLFDFELRSVATGASGCISGWPAAW